MYVALYSYYPLHPPAEDVNMDYERFEKYAFLPCNPDILILPSDLRYFAKVGNNTYSCFVAIGRFYPRDVKVVKTNLTSETLKPSGIKTGRKNEDDVTERNEIFLKKLLFFFWQRHHTQDLHHKSIKFFLDSFKNMSISESPKVNGNSFRSSAGIDANSLSSKFTPLSSPRVLAVVLIEV